MEYTLEVGKGNELVDGKHIAIIKTFKITELAETARFEVVKIVSEFHKAEEKGPKKADQD